MHDHIVIPVCVKKTDWAFLRRASSSAGMDFQRFASLLMDEAFLKLDLDIFTRRMKSIASLECDMAKSDLQEASDV